MSHAPDLTSAPPAGQPPIPHFDGPVVELDVRDDLRNKREPFSRIMAAVESLPANAVLHLRATFEPVPLFRVLTRQGFQHVVRQEGADDWSVWFHRPQGGEQQPVAPAPEEKFDPAERRAAPPPEVHPHQVVLDVRGLEPPEPMVKTLAALEALPDGAVLVQHNERVPQFLLPILVERGFQYELDESVTDMVVVRISRAS